MAKPKKKSATKRTRSSKEHYCYYYECSNVATLSSGFRHEERLWFCSEWHAILWFLQRSERPSLLEHPQIKELMRVLDVMINELSRHRHIIVTLFDGPKAQNKKPTTRRVSQ